MKKERTKDNHAQHHPSLIARVKSALYNETASFIVGLVSVLFSVYLLLAFVSFFFTGAADQSILDSGNVGDLVSVDNGVRNYAGSRGAQLANYLINDCFGLASFFILIFLAMAGLKLMKVRQVRLWRWFVGCSLLLIWFSVFFGFAFAPLYADSFIYWGGMHGYNVSRWLESQIGAPGVWMLLLVTAICFFIYLSTRTVVWLRGIFALKFLKKNKSEFNNTSESEQNCSPEVPPQPEETASVKEKETDKDEIEREEDNTDNSISLEWNDTRTAGTERPLDDVDMTVEIPESESVEQSVQASEPSFQVEANEDEEYHAKELEPYNPRLDLENYHFPTLDLMKHYDDNGPNVGMDELNEKKDKIVNTLRSFGIEISSIKATVGPTVTLYEITPEQGVRISKIRGLEDDIALNLSALGIRIIAPIPGKGTIGIEVPNEKPKIVSGQSIIGSKKFQESTYDLPIALGKTITNEVFMVDLAKMPHILVAGATGQGKSVGLNAIITSLLYKKHPSELKFVLVDPKKVEFSIYSVIEHHFLAKLPDEAEPIITDVTKVVQTLNSLCVEMDTRYDLLKAAHVRNVKEYNEKFINRQLNPEKGHRYMPYIVVVIDEFGDLIMVAGKEIEMPISRITQKARAVGMHMILATQRPSVNIITGVIKANVPSRIAFRVSASIDSRTILDAPGANLLVGKGDLLYSGGSDLVRVQCAFVDTPEVEEIVNYISQQQSYPEAYILPEYVAEGETAAPGAVDLSKRDVMFEQIARWVVAQQQGSTSAIQRTFEIGYNRAGRISDQLEAAGIVSANNGSKGRQVLVQDDYTLTQILEGLK